jgi:hypothetical protein
MAKKQKKEVIPDAIISPLQQRFKFTMDDEEKPVEGHPRRVGVTIEFGIFEDEN